MQRFANRKEMEANERLWEQHPLLVSYQDFHDATTGEVVARIATYHRRVEQWDDEKCEWVMVDLFDTSTEPKALTTKIRDSK